ncbi:MAG: YbgA family protein, partial [Deltaproteobacteria bacterium]|nr:YbgA family protein [Deltaproteobacteria bacterium]
DLLQQKMTLGGLVDFHTRNKYLILSHSQEHYRKMGKLVARGKKLQPVQLFDEYETLLLSALRLKATLKTNINVLMHILGFFKRDLTPFEKQELLTIIEQYRSGYVPLIVPITLIKHYVMKYEQPWLKIQTYLNPHPFELKLRNYF